MTTHTPIEVLGPALSKSEARPLLNTARRHYRTASRSLVQFCADLRRLQDGGAHVLYGFDNFGRFAEIEFDGLSAASAKQLSRQGHAALELAAAGRISLDGLGRDLPGTTGLRALASVLNQHGPEVMLNVYDAAAAARPGRPVVADAVHDAMRALVRPAAPAIEPPEDWGEDEPELPDEEPEEMHELRDRVSATRETLLGVLACVSAADWAGAERALEDLNGDVNDVREALQRTRVRVKYERLQASS
jgi:hypothetical protein